MVNLFEKSRDLDKSLNLRWAVRSQFRIKTFLLQDPYGNCNLNKVKVCSDILKN